jgi:hypothetical protein
MKEHSHRRTRRSASRNAGASAARRASLRPKLKAWRTEIGRCLRHLYDRCLLDDSWLADLRVVRELAEEKYADRFKRDGLALQEILSHGCDLARVEFAGGRSAEALEWVLSGRSISALEKRWDMDRSQIHYEYWQPVLDFLVDYLWKLEKSREAAA